MFKSLGCLTIFLEDDGHPVSSTFRLAYLWLTCGSCSPVRLIHRQPFHLKSTGATIVFKVPGAEASHALHAVHELEECREVGEDSLKPGEVGSQAVWAEGQMYRRVMRTRVSEGVPIHTSELVYLELPNLGLMMPHYPCKNLQSPQTIEGKQALNPQPLLSACLAVLRPFFLADGAEGRQSSLTPWDAS